MSKQNRNAQADADALAAIEDAEVRAQLAELDARMEVRQEQDRQHAQRLLDQSRQQLAADRLEAQAEALETYRQRAIAQAARSIAPQFVPFITGSSREEIDAAIDQAKAATAEILAEVATSPGQQRDELGRFASAEQQEADAIDLEHISLEDWARVRGQFIRTSDRGILGS